MGLEPIAPESYAERYQARLYQYLGITDAPVNKLPTWVLVFKDQNTGYKGKYHSQPERMTESIVKQYFLIV